MSNIIYLTQGKTTTVDDEDFERLAMFKWYFHSGYAVRNITLPNGKRKTCSMHRTVLETSAPMVDHIDGNSLNNRRSNLRGCTSRQNQWNQKIRKRSLPKGVSPIRNSGKFQAQIRWRGKLLYLGTYSTPQLAGRAYTDKARELFGDFARGTV